MQSVTYIYHEVVREVHKMYETTHIIIVDRAMMAVWGHSLKRDLGVERVVGDLPES